MKKTTFEEVTEKIRNSFLEEFEGMEKLKNTDNLTENDLDYFLARDRKAALILKTLDMDLKYELLALRTGKVNVGTSTPKRIKG